MAFWVDDFPFPKVGYVSFLEGICENDWKTNVLQIIGQIYWYLLWLGIFIQSTVQMMLSMKSIYGTDPRRVLRMLLISPSIHIPILSEQSQPKSRLYIALIQKHMVGDRPIGIQQVWCMKRIPL